MDNMRTFGLHTKSGYKLITEAEAIANAMEQKKNGVEPMYKQRIKDCISPAGWLVWSTWDDGCGVVYEHPKTGKAILVTGWQGDFII